VRAEVAILTRSWRVGGHTCTLTVPRPKAGTPQQACIEWAPHQPVRLTGAEREQYLIGRNAALVDLARELGITVGVIEL
jgi:hypothetical protein